MRDHGNMDATHAPNPHRAIPWSRASDLIRLRPVFADVALAVLIAAISLPQVASHDSLRNSAAAYLAETALIAPLAWRRRHPAGVFAIVWAAGSGLMLSGQQMVVADLAVLVALYTVATRCPPRIASTAAFATELSVVILVRPGAS
ncbi:MAG: DUF7134 domain-containing protein [Streptosporangiaceae bacterium]